MMHHHLPTTSSTTDHRYARLAAEHRVATRRTVELYASGDVAGAATIVAFPGPLRRADERRTVA